MKRILLAAILLSLSISSISSLAEDVNVNVNSTPLNKTLKKYEINEGTEDITGDKSTLKKTSEQNWKKACQEWRTDFKAANKENKIISHNCGKMDCTKEGIETTCSSKAKYKIRVLMEE